MPYTLAPGTKAPILDQDGNPILEGTTNVAIEDTSIVGLTAVAGELFLFGGALGSSDVTITKAGAAVTHEVTVSASPFDWSLGTAIPK